MSQFIKAKQCDNADRNESVTEARENCHILVLELNFQKPHLAYRRLVSRIKAEGFFSVSRALAYSDSHRKN